MLVATQGVYSQLGEEVVGEHSNKLKAAGYPNFNQPDPAFHQAFYVPPSKVPEKHVQHFMRSFEFGCMRGQETASCRIS
jgi:hypothetical protein